MPFESAITFTLDTICPWTYLAFLRLTRALTTCRTSNPSSPPLTFTLLLAPYQLHPDFSQTGEDKYTWYKREKYHDSEGRMEKYVTYMSTLFEKEGVEFSPRGMIANTLPAHRILLSLQESHSPDMALLALSSLYTQYFTHGAHPSSHPTLLKACIAAGLSTDEAEKLVHDEDKGLVETKRRMEEQRRDGVDSVPYVVFEGRKRDFTLVGAKEVGEYERVLEQIEKESS